jgi:acetolactate synthase-1/2/3 large subunit
MFSNPIACHQIAQAYDLPLLTLVFNNSEWGAVRKATMEMYPTGHASRRNTMPFVNLSPSPAFEAVVQACGGHGERVTEAEALPDAIARAVGIIRSERRQVLLNIACA